MVYGMERIVIERNWHKIINIVGKHLKTKKYTPISLKKDLSVRCNSKYNKSFHTIAKLHFQQGHGLHCYICKVKPSHVEYDGTLKLVFRNGYDATIEHVQPKSKNGRDHIDNYKIACQYCNAKRGNISLKNETLLHLYVSNHKKLKPYVDKVEEVQKTVSDLTKLETYGRLFSTTLKSLKSEISEKIESMPRIYFVKNRDEYDYYHS